MNSLLHLVKFSSKNSSSYSALIDFQQIYVRNIILFCSGLSMARLLFGHNIICQVTEKSLSQDFVDTKCFINGTMTKTSSVIYHDYYQWVSIYLLLLAFCFYFPYSIWSKCVRNYIRYIENLAEKPEDVIQVIKDSKGNLIYFKTWGLEIFYAVYTFLILVVTDIFFNRLWSSFSWSWTVIYKIFPDNGTCNVLYYHSSGTTDGWFNCLLPLCSIYRKVFSILYGLISMLILLNILMIFYRIKILVEKRRMVNVWWAFMIAESCTVSWKAKIKLNTALKSMMDVTTEDLISLKSLPLIKEKV